MARREKVSFEEIPGFIAAKEWFGYWPTFHDAEIVSLKLNRSSESRLKIHAFHTCSELNERGHYKTTKHAVVSFILDDVRDLNLIQFSSQNVISGLVLSKLNEGYSIELRCCYGLCGSLTAMSIRIEIESGMPDESVYGLSGTHQD